MDHVVYVDAKSREMEKLLDGSKTMIIRGATGRKLPYGRVDAGDELYFIRNNGEAKVYAKAAVTRVTNTPALEPAESIKMVQAAQDRLQLSPEMSKRWGGKRFLCLIEIGAVSALEPFEVDRSSFGSMDDWLPVGSIDVVKV
ncbi:MAG: hypothetical protein HGA86_07375 [Anaerolineaceae bacterium]|nr:hypothetical protein [Anaerolineaceae bacterium]